MAKYEPCPVCGKKGLHVVRLSMFLSNECRYCKSRWAIAHHTVLTQKGNKECWKCGWKGMEINGEWAVYPHMCSLPDDEITRRIQKEKIRFESKHSD